MLHPALHSDFRHRPFFRLVALLVKLEGGGDGFEHDGFLAVYGLNHCDAGGGQLALGFVGVNVERLLLVKAEALGR